MIENKRGFSYPERDMIKCIDCGKCERVCPIINKEKIDYLPDSELPKGYKAIYNDETVLLKSASGGAFSGIVEAFCDENYVIFGVQFDKDFYALHSYVEDKKEIGKYKKSKYLQSDVNKAYQEVEEFLKDNKKVLFSGTPCQVAALRLYLSKDYDNLLCVDLVCRGVPSYKTFKDYLLYLQKKHNEPIKDFSFREKIFKNPGFWNSRNISYRVKDKTIILDNIEDKYLKGFHKSLFYRPSCYECQFANEKRISDITMADFWGCSKYFPNDNVHKGVSALLINSKKGLNILEHLNEYMQMEQTSPFAIIDNNSQLRNPTYKHPKYEAFFSYIDRGLAFDKAVDRCIPTLPIFLRKVVNRIIPLKIKQNLLKLKKGFDKK